MQNSTTVKWEEKTLKDICSFYRGLTYSKKDEVTISGNIVLRANNIDLNSNTLNFDELKYINDETQIPQEKKVVKDTILMCISSGSKSHLGKVAYIDNDYNYAFGGFMGLIKPNENTNAKWLYYLLITPDFKDLVFNLTDGANINNLKFSDLQDYQLKLLPLPEQERIVKVLDEVFENIDKAKQNAQQNLNNAKELFESYLDKVFTENTDNWNKNLLKDISKSIQYGYTESANYNNIGPKFLRITDIQNDNVNWSTVPYCQITQQDKEKYLLQNGDIVFARTGATVGKSFLINNLQEEAVFASYLIKVSLNKDLLLPLFVKYFFKSNLYWNQITDKQTGAGQPNVNGTKLGQLHIIYPSLNDQQKIVAQLDELQAETKKLEAIYEQKIKDLDELKQSILQKAFNGEL